MILHLRKAAAATTLFIALQVSLVVAQHQTDNTSPVRLNSNLGYTIGLRPVDFGIANLPTLHSYSVGTWNGRWVMMAGRTNGLHGFSDVGSQNFPVASQNRDVWVIDRNVDQLRALSRQFGGSLRTEFSTQDAVERRVLGADLVIGSVLVPGAAAPRLVSADTVRKMKPGAVMIDIAIDQGGCFETSKPTTHSKPTYIVDDIVHYCVTNMPGAVGRTSTYALTNVTLPYVLQLAKLGFDQAIRNNVGLAQGINIHAGKVTNKAVADTFNLQYTPIN